MNRMNRIKALFIIVVSLFLLTACAKMNLSEERLSGLAEKSVTQLQSGNFDAVYDNLSSKLKPNLPRKTLKEKWVKATEKIGNLVENQDAKVIMEERYASVSIVSEYEKNGLKTSISYDPKGEIIAFDVNFFPLETEPFNTDKFTETDIVLENGEYPLKARLTLPTNVANPPLVIFVQDIGAWDLDATIGAVANKPMRDIAHGLAEKGIASFRYDKRFFTYPEFATQNAQTLTIEDEVLNDVNGILELAQNEHIDKNRIYILGHGMGGMLAPEIVNQNPNICGIISLASTPRRLEDVIVEQNIALISADKLIADKDKKQYINQLKNQADEIKKISEETKPAFLLNMPTTYWNSLNKIDTEKLAESLNIPMLFLQGTEDFKYPMEKDFDEWKKLLAGKKNVDFIEYKGLNHMFLKSNGKKDLTEYDTEGKVDDKVVSDIATWIGANK